MFVKNWYKALAAEFAYLNNMVSCTDFTGEQRTFSSPSSYSNLRYGNTGSTYHTSLNKLFTTLNNNYAGVLLGTGTTEVTADDYTLSGEIITTITYSASVSSKETDDGFEITGLYTITNTGSDRITIGEVGLVGFWQAGSNTASKILLDRTVLDEPVTIEAGGVGTVTYTIRMNYPTA